MSSFKLNKLHWLIKKVLPLRLLLWSIKITLLILGALGFTVVLYFGGLITLIFSFLLTSLYLIGLWKIPDFFYTSLIEAFKLMTKASLKIKISGKDNIPKQGKAIIAARHRDALDIPFMAIAALPQRKIKFIARQDLNWLKYLKPAQKYTIKIDRSNFGLSDFKNITRSLEQNELVGIFPEGTTSSTETYHPGMLKIAERTDTSIIPLNIESKELHEAEKWWHSLWKRIHRIKVNLKVEKSLTVTEIKERCPEKKDYEKITEFFFKNIVDQI